MKQVYMSGQIIEGTISGIQPYGAFVQVDENTTGLIHISEISDDFVRDIRQFVTQGEKIIAKVIDIDKGTQQLRLSLKALNYSHRKAKSEQSTKRPLLPKHELGFKTLAEMLPRWIENEGDAQ